MGLMNRKVLTCLMFKIVSISCLGTTLYTAYTNTYSGEGNYQISTSIMSRPEDCLLLCTPDPLCYGANFILESGTCHLVSMGVLPFAKNHSLFQENSTFYLKSTGCPSGYIPLLESCYRVVRHPANWADSRSFCQSDQGDLISFETEEEYETVKTIILQRLIEPTCNDPSQWTRQAIAVPDITRCRHITGKRYLTLQGCYDLACDVISYKDHARISINYQLGRTACNVKRCPTADIRYTYNFTDYGPFDIPQFIGGKFWTSGQEVTTEGQWEWTSGDPLTWGQGELRDTDNGNQDCLYMLTSFPGIRINDERCDFKYYYICEIKKE